MHSGLGIGIPVGRYSIHWHSHSLSVQHCQVLPVLCYRRTTSENLHLSRQQLVKYTQTLYMHIFIKLFTTVWGSLLSCVNLWFEVVLAESFNFSLLFVVALQNFYKKNTLTVNLDNKLFWFGFNFISYFYVYKIVIAQLFNVYFKALKHSQAVYMSMLY